MSSSFGYRILIDPEVHKFLMLGLNHFELQARKLTIDQLTRHFGDEKIAERYHYVVCTLIREGWRLGTYAPQKELFAAVCERIADEELVIARMAIDWIVNFFQHVQDQDSRKHSLTVVREYQSK